MADLNLADTIDVLVNQKEAEVINIRRDIHMHPEVSGKEERTSGIVAEYLEKHDIEVQRCKNSFGVVGRLKGSKPGPIIALRADMDALPIREKTGLPYASKIDGQMHACGHDVHTAVLMGTASVLSTVRDKLNGTAIFLFQPSEEFFPGGALGLIEEGGIDNPKPNAIFALHTSPIPLGKIAISPGPVIGSVSSLSLRIFGRGGHFSAPHLAVDPILVSSNVVVALSSMVPRRVNPMENAVLTFGMIEGGTRDNIIGDMVVLRGNIGSLNESLCVKLMEDLEKTVKGITEGMGATYKLRYIHGYPTVRNDPHQTTYVRDVATRVIGESNVVPCTPSLGGEDMSYFLNKIPGAFFFLGVHDPDSDQPPVINHDPAFAPDERAIAIGMRLMSRLVTDAAD
ncbi:M20 metallopeptidase family protein [Desulfatitalea tepidiphila]|uniref:M20 metallopeptidase family protein n=1 Tax=Desulfatitalea tepidiphila TaxID=1185843 RepID=UPI0006B530C7|nr:M20 family metallopeptidase [Desulfatitalea tepidiphila]